MNFHCSRLDSFSRVVTPLPGIAIDANRRSLSRQIVDSIHRTKYIAIILNRPHSPSRADPQSALFDPIRAAILKHRAGEIDEAFWLVFLFVLFGKHICDGYRLLKDIYRALGPSPYWTWARTSADPGAFKAWLNQNEPALRQDDIKRRFGNHRKYSTLKTSCPTGVAAAIESYVKWVGPNRGHDLHFADAVVDFPGVPATLFDGLYASLDAVLSFGRTAKFDYLTMLGKLGFVALEPGIPYLNGASGPLYGARLLFYGDANTKGSVSALEKQVVELGNHLCVGMQVMEDSLCNWQKSPSQFLPFRG